MVWIERESEKVFEAYAESSPVPAPLEESWSKRDKQTDRDRDRDGDREHEDIIQDASSSFKGKHNALVLALLEET